MNAQGDEREIGERGSAFRAARARAAVELTAFLPARDHPLFRKTRLEILRLDLEFAWREGQRRLLLDYIGVFPDLLEDRAAIKALALAEFRLRSLAGEDPSTTEYEWHYGLTAADW